MRWTFQANSFPGNFDDPSYSCISVLGPGFDLRLLRQRASVCGRMQYRASMLMIQNPCEDLSMMKSDTFPSKSDQGTGSRRLWRLRCCHWRQLRRMRRSPGGLATECRRKARQLQRLPAPSTCSNGVTDEAIRSVVQIGVYHVLSGGPAIPWTVEPASADRRQTQGRRRHAGQPDDRRLSQHHLWPAGARRGDRQNQAVDSGRGPGRHACRRIQLLRAPRHGGLLRRGRPGRRRIDRRGLRPHEGPSAARQRKARTRSTRCGPTSRIF